MISDAEFTDGIPTEFSHIRRIPTTQEIVTHAQSVENLSKTPLQSTFKALQIEGDESESKNLTQTLTELLQKNDPRVIDLIQTTGKVVDSIKKLPTTSPDKAEAQEKFIDHFTILTQKTIRSTISQFNNPEPSQALTQESLQSLREIADLMSPDPRIQNDLHLSERYKNILYFDAENKELLDQARPIAVHWLLNQIAMSAGNSDDVLENTRIFYTTLGEALLSSASETTGDTSQEIEILKIIFKRLNLPEEWTLYDLGSASGNRILPDLCKYLLEERIEPKKIVAIDLVQQDNFPKKIHDIPTEFHQMDVSHPDGIITPEESVNAVIAQWSLINELPHEKQLQMLANTSKKIKKGGYVIIEFPTLENYREQAEEYHEKHPEEPFGTIEKEFTVVDPNTKEEKTARKKFYITPAEEIIAKSMQAGLHPIQNKHDEFDGILSYETSNGVERCFLILQKVEDPQTQILEAAAQMLA